jgi:sugar lactone lactonase YvrE
LLDASAAILTAALDRSLFLVEFHVRASGWTSSRRFSCVAMSAQQSVILISAARYDIGALPAPCLDCRRTVRGMHVSSSRGGRAPLAPPAGSLGCRGDRSHRKEMASMLSKNSKWWAGAAVALTLAAYAAPAAAQQEPTYVSGAASRCTGPAIRCPGFEVGIPQGDYNLSLRSQADIQLPNPYARDETWLKMPPGKGKLGSTSAINVDADGKSVWIVRRCEENGCIGSHVDPVMKFDENGNFVRSFGADMIVYPHGMWVDQQGNVWVADTQSNMESRRGAPPPAGTVPSGDQILKFSPTGKLLMRLGTPGVYGHDNSHFNQPSDVITAPNGDIFVADGHELTNMPYRIVVFDKTGKYLREWPLCDDKGAQTSDCSHSLAMDSQGRLFVADRGNNRIVIYDQFGKKLADWKQFGRPSGLYIDKNDVLYSADSESSVINGNAYVRGVHVGDARTGKVTAFLPDVLGNPTPWSPLRGTTGAEGVAADAAGHIFTSQVMPFGQIARYTRK